MGRGPPWAPKGERSAAPTGEDVAVGVCAIDPSPDALEQQLLPEPIKRYKIIKPEIAFRKEPPRQKSSLPAAVDIQS